MSLKLKKLTAQTIVITGASSGIGLVTARMAAKRGAGLVLAARSAEALLQLEHEINREGGRAIHVVADVSQFEDVARIAATAIERFGGFDTWINNAGVSIYGRIDETPIDDMRKLFDTNFWGVVNGSLVAAQHLKERGGTIIQMGSEVSERAMPLQGIYSASKHAVKGFTDAFRMELEKEGAPISVTLLKPASVDTPLPQHAKNYLPTEPQQVAPVYAPEVVAEAILHAAEHPLRDLFIGAAGRITHSLNYHAPALLDSRMERTLFDQTRSHHPAREDQHKGLEQPAGDLRERGGHEGHVAESSLYTRATLHPFLTGALVASAAAMLIGAALRPRNHQP